MFCISAPISAVLSVLHVCNVHMRESESGADKMYNWGLMLGIGIHIEHENIELPENLCVKDKLSMIWKILRH